jgi:hypothetical protein
MDRAVRALCWRPFVRQIGNTDALIMDVMHQIKAYLRKKFGHTRKRSAKAQSFQNQRKNLQSWVIFKKLEIKYRRSR